MTNNKTLLEMAIETYDRWNYLAQIAHLNKDSQRFEEAFDVAKRKLKSLHAMVCDRSFFSELATPIVGTLYALHTWRIESGGRGLKFRLTFHCKDKDGFNLPSEKVTVRANPKTEEVEVTLIDVPDTRLGQIRWGELEGQYKNLFNQKVDCEEEGR